MFKCLINHSEGLGLSEKELENQSWSWALSQLMSRNFVNIVCILYKREITWEGNKLWESCMTLMEISCMLVNLMYFVL